MNRNNKIVYPRYYQCHLVGSTLYGCITEDKTVEVTIDEVNHLTEIILDDTDPADISYFDQRYDSSPSIFQWALRYAISKINGAVNYAETSLT